jgi:dienelactone hydrolase
MSVRMHRAVFAVFAVVLAACGSSSVQAPPPPKPSAPPVAAHADAAAGPARTDPQAIARDVVAHLVAHDFAAVASRFDERMSAGLPADKLSATWSKLEAAVGAFDRVESVSTKDSDGFHVVSVTAHFATTRLVLLISIDDRGRLGGFFVRPGDQAAEWRPPAYARLDAIEDRPVTVGTSPALPGTLTLPRGAGPFPGVVLVHGSGPNDADETIGAIKVFKDLALGLASRGIAVLRYEKRTHSSPAGVRTQKEEVDDAAHAAIALVKATPGIDARRIVLLGHSQGGYLAPRIARADPAIRGLVILAGSTRPLEDSILAQLKYLAALTPADAQLSSLIGDAEKFKQAVESPALKPDDALASPIGGDIPGAYFLEVRDYHPEKVAASLAIPIAILQGERDYQVTIADDFAAWKTALGKRKNVAFYTYPDANHAFVGGTGPSTPAEYSRPGHVEDKVIDDIATWIAALQK